MNQSNNIITFPQASAARQRRQHEAPASTAPIVIDLESRRRAARIAGKAIQRTPGALTPGEVWDALNEGRLVMHYQPQYDLSSGKMIAAEALARLVSKTGELIFPDCFVDEVEQGDLIVPLGRAVIDHVCADLAAIRAQGNSVERIAINLSARQLNVDTTLLSFIDFTLTHFGLEYADLEFEITERQSLTPHCEGLAVLDELAQRGVRIVIDDFGIGYSSIVYLAELPISAFKLDRALISRLPEDSAMRTLVDTLLTLATSLNLEVVAEGIETRAQHDYLLDAGCPYAQGFAYAKPMSASDLQAFIADGAATHQQNTLRF